MQKSIGENSKDLLPRQNHLQNINNALKRQNQVQKLQIIDLKLQKQKISTIHEAQLEQSKKMIKQLQFLKKNQNILQNNEKLMRQNIKQFKYQNSMFAVQLNEKNGKIHDMINKIERQSYKEQYLLKQRQKMIGQMQNFRQLTSANQILQTEKDQTLKIIKKFEKQIIEKEANKNKQKHIFQQSIKTKDQKIKQLQSQVDKIKQTHVLLKEEVLKNKNINVENSVKNQAKIDQLIKEVTRSSDIIKQKDVQIQKLQTQINISTVFSNKIQGQNQNLQKKYMNLQQKIQSNQIDILKLKDQLQIQSIEAQKYKTASFQNSQLVNNLQLVNRELRTQINVKTTFANKVQGQNKNTFRKYKNLQQKMQNNHDEMLKLKDKLIIQSKEAQNYKNLQQKMQNNQDEMLKLKDKLIIQSKEAQNYQKMSFVQNINDQLQTVKQLYKMSQIQNQKLKNNLNRLAQEIVNMQRVIITQNIVKTKSEPTQINKYNNEKGLFSNLVFFYNNLFL